MLLVMKLNGLSTYDNDYVAENIINDCGYYNGDTKWDILIQWMQGLKLITNHLDVIFRSV